MLIIYKDKTSIYSDYFSYENCWIDDIFCLVQNGKISFDGVTWEDIEIDHL